MDEGVVRTVAKLGLRAALGRRLPKYDGEVRASGIHRDVQIVRDGHGVPTIRGATDHDVFFGLGFCHGQDRAFQLEILLRTVRGTMAEIAGEDGVPVDRLSRRIGFRRAALGQLAVARPDVRDMMEAYAAGINAAHRVTTRSHEHVLLGCEPTSWQAADAQAVSVLLCFALASNWDAELLRLEMLTRDGPDAVVALDAPYPEDLPVSTPPFSRAGATAGRLLDDLAALSKVFPLGGASNAWALSGAKTATGRPMLASDPHLPPDVPVHWYLAHLVASDWRATGAGFVGIPGIGIGHSEHCAWGVTAAHADNTDFFVEEIGPDGRSIRAADGGFTPCDVLVERIEVKGKPAVTEEILLTPRGPIVGPAFAGAPVALSLSATWLAHRPYTGLFLAHKAKTASEIHDLFREASCSSVNLVVADRDGHIGWRLGVEIPIRKAGHGMVPRAGWLPDSGWERELVPFERMPALVDPPHGFVASANNAPQPLDHDGPYFGVDFLDGYRKELLTEELERRGALTLADSSELQRDVRSTVWRRVRDAFVAAPATDDDGRTGVRLLEAWDGRVARDSAAASVWELASTTLVSRAVRTRAPNTAGRALGAGFHPALPNTTMITRRTGHLVRLLTERPEGFFAEGYDAAIASSIAGAVRTLRERHGDDPARWGWGEVRPLRLHHALGKAIPALDYLLGLGPFPFEGDASTLAQGTLDFVDPLSGPVGVPNLRVVIDVGDWARSRFALLAGQSGNPLSPHFADHYPAFTSGEGLTIAWTDADADASGVHRLTLVPG